MSESIETAPRRRAFIDRFVGRVDVFKDSRMTIVGDFFGVKMTIEAIKQAEKDGLSVRMETTDPRHRKQSPIRKPRSGFFFPTAPGS